jgi:hypothetical protein
VDTFQEASSAGLIDKEGSARLKVISGEKIINAEIEPDQLSFRTCGPQNFMKEVERNDSSFAAPSRLFSPRAAIAP